MFHRRLVYIYLLNVPSFSSRYFNKIKRTSLLGSLLALSLEILYLIDLKDETCLQLKINKCLYLIFDWLACSEMGSVILKKER